MRAHAKTDAPPWSSCFVVTASADAMVGHAHRASAPHVNKVDGNLCLTDLRKMIDVATFRCSLVPLVWMLPFTRILLVALGHLDVVGNIQIRENNDENADSCSLHRQGSLDHNLHHAQAQSDRVQASQKRISFITSNTRLSHT